MKPNRQAKRYSLFIVLIGLLSISTYAQKDTLVVARDGTGNYRTLTEALDNIRAYMDYTIVVYIKNGTYKEKVIIPSWLKNVKLVGESKENVLITYDDHANINKMGTFRTYTVRIDGSFITLENLTIENNAAPLGQAVALHTEGNNLLFKNCGILGNQDTVFTGGEYTRMLFEKCYIEGTTDFIFGGATAYFDSCTIHSKKNSYITAASTPKDVPFGYVFYNCNLTAEENLAVYLGRPWRSYGSTAFIKCNMEKHIQPQGWHNWNNVENEQTARYYEGDNFGPGSETKDRVQWVQLLNAKEILSFSKEKVLGNDSFFRE